MNEYEKLLQHYGVSTQETPYAGLTGESPEAVAERSAYDDWHDQYKKRMLATKLYGPSWQGDILGAPKFTSPLAAATVAPEVKIPTAAPMAITPMASPMGGGGGGGSGYQPTMGGGGAGYQAPSATDQYSLANSLGYNIGFDSNRAMLGGALMGSPLGALAGVSVSKDPLGQFAYQQLQAQEAREQAAPATGGGSGYGLSADGQDRGYGGMGPVSGSGGGGGGGGSDSDGGGGGTDHGEAGNRTDARGGYACGGPVKFADGGLAELNAKYAPSGMEGSADIAGNMGLDMSRVSPEQLQMMQQQDPGALQRGQERFIENDLQSPAAEPLQAMSQRYEAPAAPRQYAEAYGAARKESQADQATFNKMIEEAMAQKSEGPSKAEMYFNLAAAFGAPTRTGSFVESLGNAGKVMGEHGKAVRESASADRQRRQALGMQAAGARAQASRADMSDLRQLAIQEGKDYLASRMPQSAAGKEAMDRGYIPGTPEYQKAVSDIGDMLVKKQTAQIDAIAAAQGNQGARLKLAQTEAEAKAGERSKLTSPELKLKTDTEDMVAQTDQALENLRKAYQLNPTTFDTSLGDKAQRIALEAAGSKDPKVVNTREMENLLEKAALSSLKSTFPGAISNDERKALQDVQGLGAKSIEERRRIMKNGYMALKTVAERSRKRLADINAGKYRETTPSGVIEIGE